MLQLKYSYIRSSRACVFSATAWNTKNSCNHNLKKKKKIIKQSLFNETEIHACTEPKIFSPFCSLFNPSKESLRSVLCKVTEQVFSHCFMPKHEVPRDKSKGKKKIHNLQTTD